MRTVKQIARASGTSVRALHHYDHIGLLKPEIGANGYRYYGQAELLRLQQILFYRELGLTLAAIARILDDPAYDTRTALTDLRRRVTEDIAHRHRLADTIDRTLAAIAAGREVSAQGLFDGVSAERQAAWEAEIVALYGSAAHDAIDASRTAQAALSPSGLLDFRAEIDAIHAAFVARIVAGDRPDAPEVQTLAGRHHWWVCRSWRPDADAYAALGHLYRDHAEFRAMYDALHPGLAVFLADAMAIYAGTAL